MTIGLRLKYKYALYAHWFLYRRYTHRLCFKGAMTPVNQGLGANRILQLQHLLTLDSRRLPLVSFRYLRQKDF